MSKIFKVSTKDPITTVKNTTENMLEAPSALLVKSMQKLRTETSGPHKSQSRSPSRVENWLVLFLNTNSTAFVFAANLFKSRQKVTQMDSSRLLKACCMPQTNMRCT